MKKIITTHLLFLFAINLFAQSYTTESKLKSGNWHKISIPKDGIYKLDYNFINSNFNVNPQNVSFSDFGVFGQGMGLLPESNAAFRVDDLAEIGIHINDANNNGRWDPADFVLFYGKGPDLFTFNASNQQWGHEKNPYADKSTYLISLNQGSGKSIPVSSTQNVPGSAITQYDFFDVFEEEINNLVYTEYRRTMGSGREWYGRALNNISPSQNFSFNVPNIVSSQPVVIRTKLAANSRNTTNFSIIHNGTTLYNQSIDGISHSNYPPVAISNIQSGTFTSNGTINIEIRYNSSSSQDKGWIDYTQILAKANLILNGNSLLFRNLGTFGQAAKFRVSNANSNTQIWDITRGHDVRRLSGSLSNGQLEFSAPADTILKYFVAVNVNSAQFPLPEYEKSIVNQNLHGINNVDLVIVTNNDLLQAAERLAGFRRAHNGFKVEVVLIDEIYNEFSSGQQDLTAIRDFFRMLYKRGQEDNYPFRYALLFGDASFDFKDRIPGNENQNIIPSYQSYESLNILQTFVTDDFFGFLDDDEGENLTIDQGDIDIAIGRFPVSTIDEANGLVDKIIHYNSRQSFGDWRNELTFVADDGDNNLHLNDAERLSEDLEFDRKDYYNIDKIYLDAFQRVSGAGGNRYPDVNESILRKLFQGSFVMNYSGHGGPENWAQERVFNISDIRNLDNIDKLPLFITATCDFAPYDDPAFHSAGETLLTNERGGAIALITTTRLVFASANLELNRAVLTNLFKEYEGRMPTIGEVMQIAKNNIFGGENNRKFILLGDPSMTLAYPQNEVIATHINDEPIDEFNMDTLKALSRVKIRGQVTDAQANILSNFNGIVYPSVFDKPRVLRTRANGSGSLEVDFEVQNSLLFKGAATVANGEFEFEFIVPKDINYRFDNGKLSFYALANDSDIDAHGYSRDFLVGGTADDFEEDFDGPKVELFINDTNFVFGGISHENPLLIARLEDESGINTVGNGIGHDITAVLNGNTQNQYLLNDFYEAALDDFTRGEVRFPFNRLEDGRYTIEVRAWDVHNNSGRGYTEFVVVSSEKLALESLLNYPNPFGQVTNFIFEHNMPGEQINVTIDIYNYNGQKVKTLSNTILSEGTRLSGGKITWDGTSDFGTPLANGMYLYKLKIQNEEGLTAQEFEKLMILK